MPRDALEEGELRRAARASLRARSQSMRCCKLSNRIHPFVQIEGEKTVAPPREFPQFLRPTFERTIAEWICGHHEVSLAQASRRKVKARLASSIG